MCREMLKRQWKEENYHYEKGRVDSDPCKRLSFQALLFLAIIGVDVPHPPKAAQHTCTISGRSNEKTWNSCPFICRVASNYGQSVLTQLEMVKLTKTL